MKAKAQQQRQTKRIAAERISHLFATAERFYATDPALSDRAVAVARAIAMRQRLRLERGQRRSFCHACHAYLVPGSNARVRVRDGHVTVTCLVCGNRARYGTGRHERREPDAGSEADLLDRQAGNHRRDDR